MQKAPENRGFVWWAHKGSNLGPLPCEGNALPLSYAPGICASIKGCKPAIGQTKHAVRALDLRSGGDPCQAKYPAVFERFQAKACPALDARWKPVRVKKTR